MFEKYIFINQETFKASGKQNKDGIMIPIILIADFNCLYNFNDKMYKNLLTNYSEIFARS